MRMGGKLLLLVIQKSGFLSADEKELGVDNY